MKATKHTIFFAALMLAASGAAAAETCAPGQVDEIGSRPPIHYQPVTTLKTGANEAVRLLVPSHENWAVRGSIRDAKVNIKVNKPWPELIGQVLKSADACATINWDQMVVTVRDVTEQRALSQSARDVGSPSPANTRPAAMAPLHSDSPVSVSQPLPRAGGPLPRVASQTSSSPVSATDAPLPRKSSSTGRSDGGFENTPLPLASASSTRPLSQETGVSGASTTSSPGTSPDVIPVSEGAPLPLAASAGVSAHSRYLLKMGDSLQDTMERWARDARWTLIWEPARHYPVQINHVFPAGTSFEDALEVVLSSYWGRSDALSAELHANRVVRITPAIR